MSLTQEQSSRNVLESSMGRYEIVKLAFAWISLKQHDEDYRKLSQQDLISKAISDVTEGIATPEAIEVLRNKRKSKENKEAALAATAALAASAVTAALVANGDLAPAGEGDLETDIEPSMAELRQEVDVQDPQEVEQEIEEAKAEEVEEEVPTEEENIEDK
jgi:hypothetical protein